MSDTLFIHPNIDPASDQLVLTIGSSLLLLLVASMFYVGLREAFKKRGN